MISLGSLVNFIPGLDLHKQSAEDDCKLFNPSSSFRASLNANSLNLSFNSTFGKRYSAMSTGGYCFSNSIKNSRERIKLQSQQRPRRILMKNRIKKRESSAPFTKDFKEKTRSFAGKSFDLFEENIKNELQ